MLDRGRLSWMLWWDMECHHKMHLIHNGKIECFISSHYGFLICIHYIYIYPRKLTFINWNDSTGWWEIWGTSLRRCSRPTCRCSCDICVSREQTMLKRLLMVCPGKGCQGNMFWQESASCPWSGRRWGYYKMWHQSPGCILSKDPYLLANETNLLWYFFFTGPRVWTD